MSVHSLNIDVQKLANAITSIRGSLNDIEDVIQKSLVGEVLHGSANRAGKENQED